MSDRQKELLELLDQARIDYATNRNVGKLFEIVEEIIKLCAKPPLYKFEPKKGKISVVPGGILGSSIVEND